MRPVRWRARSVGLIALAAVAGGVLFTLTRESETAQSGFAPEAAESRTSGSTAVLERLPVEAAGAPETTSRELPDGVWIRGRVVLPAGTPSDERVEVAARVLSFDDSPGYLAEIDGEGKFSAMFPKDSDSGWLEVHARYLVLQPNHEVDLESPPEEIVLEPVLGARVRGRIVAPGRPESETRALAGMFVEISSKGGPGFRCFSSRRTCVGDDLSFEFLALPPCAGYELSVSAEDFLPSEMVIAPPMGTTAEVRLDLRAGVRVSGRVLAPAGEPVEGARIWRIGMPPPSDFDWGRPDVTSDADGSFSMTAIPPGDVAIAFKTIACLPEIVELGRLQEGDVRAGVEVRLRTSLVHGRVEWPDGTPAPDAVVELSLSASLDGFALSRLWMAAGPDWYQPVRASVRSQGAFRLEAPHEGPFSLFARSPEDPETDAEVLAGRRTGGVAVLDGVRPGAEPVVIVLEPAQSVRGRVTDDLGGPVSSFSVRGYRESQLGADSLLSSVGGVFFDPDGAFAFVGLSPGEWRFQASADDRENTGWKRVVLPNQGEPVVLVIPRATTVSGIVVDPDGHPVHGAAVRSVPNGVDVTGEKGQFELENLPAGEVELWAKAESFAQSERVRVSVEPAGTASGVRIVLRRGGTIECRVLDPEGNPEPGRGIRIESPGAQGLHDDVETPDERSDDDGRIVIEDLAPGPYLLTKEPTMQEMGRESSGRTQASADVVAGGVTRVVVGGPKGSPITVRGRVTDEGAPVAGIVVQAWSPRTRAKDQVERTTGADGRFEFLVDQPTEMTVVLRIEREGIDLATLRRVGGDGREEMNLQLPRGRISGVVRPRDDRPLEGVGVYVESQGTPGSLGTWSANGWATTGSDGRFSFEHLPGGSYELSRSGDSTSEDGTETKIRLSLEEGGHLEDVVIPPR